MIHPLTPESNTNTRYLGWILIQTQSRMNWLILRVERVVNLNAITVTYFDLRGGRSPARSQALTAIILCRLYFPFIYDVCTIY